MTTKLATRKSMCSLAGALFVTGAVVLAQGPDPAKLDREAREQAEDYLQKAREIAKDRAAKLRLLRDQVEAAEKELAEAMKAVINREEAAGVAPPVILGEPSALKSAIDKSLKSQPGTPKVTTAFVAIDYADPAYFEHESAIVGAKLRNSDPKIVGHAIEQIDQRRDELLQERSRLNLQSVPATDPRQQEVERRLLGAEKNRRRFVQMLDQIKQLPGSQDQPKP